MSLSWTDDLPEDLKNKVAKVEKLIQPRLEEIDQQVLYNQQRVLNLFRKHRVGEEDLVPSTGYGYDDIGRDKIEAIYADYFKVDDALVRPQFASGTHAISTALFSMLRPGNTLYYLTGTPYDTIQEVIGLAGNKRGNMKEYGIDFKATELLDDGSVDYDQAKKDLQDESIKVVAIQRSRGYAVRDSFTVEKIAKMIKFVKSIRPDVNVFIDNCYGEFSEKEEPTFYGADIMAGSLYKNAGAGLVKSGAYIVGREDLVDGAGSRLTVPGAGKGEGATWGYLRDFYQGFFMAAHTTGEALKGMIFTSALCEEMGMNVSPKWDAPRTDIVQTVSFGDPDPMVKFCAAIQHYSPMNSFVDPIPSHQDGYEDDVVMASGSFVEGSTIELSSDGPIRPPYSLYIQGGLSYAHVQIAITQAVRETFYK
ncbi:MAG TPA: methionine gamma-lyase family protein [Companilactobacillus farciminis]|jgi:cystathionine beta-lyase family protein involved in aluminum resistance|uniref:Methionine gamma-lyase family protein n=3 Tax=Companilactobacillus TaxID=2767879 RepID=A0A921L9H7_9LACO|nr:MULTISPECIES: methionine gamma-lyase family protein [Companilactobacillus]KRK92186.1 aluminum resistance protein [Companilactobacillus futsaii JCM 17355]QCX25647.1 aluminum resistance protein [Companilactobacillus futsaii]WCG35370.1 methionine gamma-lyase family protein [Companilactobacillus farciminis]GAQ02309.1 aluminum resistance protein [Companilactobacillus farciminis]HJF87225.1 methionine gamma-lyase family protein [Companilactobacillus farciminis]